jgi:hypothetical protein
MLEGFLQPAAGARGESAHLQVFPDRHVFVYASAFGHQGDPEAGYLVGPFTDQGVPVETDLAGRRGEGGGDGGQERRLAGAVAPNMATRPLLDREDMSQRTWVSPRYRSTCDTSSSADMRTLLILQPAAALFPEPRPCHFPSGALKWGRWRDPVRGRLPAAVGQSSVSHPRPASWSDRGSAWSARRLANARAGVRFKRCVPFRHLGTFFIGQLTLPDTPE